MYLTCWKKLRVEDNCTFEEVIWSTNLRVSDNYYELVVEDCKTVTNNDVIRSYLVKQYSIDVDEGTMLLLNQTKFEKPITQRRVINAS